MTRVKRSSLNSRPPKSEHMRSPLQEYRIWPLLIERPVTRGSNVNIEDPLISDHLCMCLTSKLTPFILRSVTKGFAVFIRVSIVLKWRMIPRTNRILKSSNASHSWDKRTNPQEPVHSLLREAQEAQ